MEKQTYKLEVKALDDSGTVEGFASVFENVDYSNDIVKKGAFSSVKRPTDVKMLWQHDPEQPIGVWESLVETAEGLVAKGKLLLDVQKAREAYALLKHGALDGLSIGFNVPSGGSKRDQKGRRVINSVDLQEISLVTFPCNDAARVTAVKNFNIDEVKSKRDFEHLLREAGFSRSQAACLASGWSPAQRDVEGKKSRGTELPPEIKRACEALRSL